VSSSAAAGAPGTPAVTGAGAPPADPARAHATADPVAAEAGLVAGGDGYLSAARDAPVGGQAVIEGVMMRGVRNWAVAVRKPSPEQESLAEQDAPREPPDGEIEVQSFPLRSAQRRHRLLRLPIIRGVVALGGSL